MSSSHPQHQQQARQLSSSSSPSPSMIEDAFEELMDALVLRVNDLLDEEEDETPAPAPPPELSVVKEIVDECPQVLEMRDSDDRSPLVAALLNDRCPFTVIKYLVTRCRESLLESRYDSDNNTTALPIHEALEHGVSDELIVYLIRMGPGALREEDGYGRLPAHTAALRNKSVRVMRAMIEPYPHALYEKEREHLQTPLGIALEYSDDLDVVKYLLRRGPNVLADEGEVYYDDDANECEEEPVFHAAARAGVSPERLALLLQYRPEALRQTTKLYRYLPVHCAAESSASPSGFAAFQFLVNLWPESLQVPSGDNADADLPLHIVLAHPERDTYYGTRPTVPLVDRVRYVLGTWPGAIRSTAGPRHHIPLHRAILEGAPDNAVELLLDEWPESIHELTQDGDTILHVLSQTEHARLGTLELLVGRDESIVDAQCTKDGSLPIHSFADLDARQRLWVSGEPTIGFVRFLVDRRPHSIRVRDQRGCFPVHRALSNPNQSSEVVEFLAAQGPDTLYETNQEGLTPLHIVVVEAAATPARMDASVERARILLRHRPEAIAIGNSIVGLTPLHLAASRGDGWMPLLRILVEARPDTCMIPATDGRLALHCAASCAALEVTRCLLEHRPDAAMAATTDSKRQLPIHCALAVRTVDETASQEEWLSLVKVLADAGPESLQVKDGNGMIPLLVAASNPSTSLDVLWYLLIKCPLSVSTLRARRPASDGGGGGGTTPSLSLSTPPVGGGPSKRQRRNS